MVLRSDTSFIVGVRSLLQKKVDEIPVELTGTRSDIEIPFSRIIESESITVRGILNLAASGVMFNGNIKSSWVGTCRRCLEMAKGIINVQAREIYIENPDPESEYPLSGDQVDLGLAVHDLLLLELPLAPVCTDSCKGLCPTCGANLNETSCNCMEPKDLRWSALDILRDEI